jgi:Hypothetical glycosyl hydrolase family 15
MLRRRKPSCLRIAAAALILATLSLALPASAVSATRTYVAVNVHCDIATFKLVGLKPATVRAARVTRGQRAARVKPAVVRRAARRGTLRLRLSTLRWTSLRPRTHKPRTATRRHGTRGTRRAHTRPRQKQAGQERNAGRHHRRAGRRRRAERHDKRARREKHTRCRDTRARPAGVRRKRPKLTVITSADHAPPPPPPSGERPAVTFTRYNQANGGTGFAVSAGRDEFIVLQGFWRRSEIQQISNANPGVKLLIYKNVSRYQAPDAFGNYNSCLTASQASSNPFGVDWSSTVSDADSGGNIVKPVAGTGDEYGRWCLDRLKAQLQASQAAGFPVDGIFLDDDNSYAPGVDGGYPDANLNGTADNQPRGADAAAWNAWMEAANSVIGPGLTAAGYVPVPNLDAAIGERNLESGGWDERQLGYFPAVFAEFTAFWPGGGLQPQSFLNETFRLMGLAQAQHTIFVGSETNLSESQMNVTLGMLLIKTEGFASFGAGQGNVENWFPSYDRAKALGQPTGPATSPGPGVWTRQFASGGTVRVDLNARTATIP